MTRVERILSKSGFLHFPLDEDEHKTKKRLLDFFPSTKQTSCLQQSRKSVSVVLKGSSAVAGRLNMTMIIIHI